MKNLHCYFCINQFKDIDFKHTHLLSKFISRYKKIIPRKYTGACSKHQRKLAQAIKRARIMALMPFVPK